MTIRKRSVRGVKLDEALLQAREGRNGTSSISDVLSREGYSRARQRVTRRRSIRPTPIHDFDDDKFRDMLVNLVDRLESDDDLKRDFDEDRGLNGENGVARSFERVLTDMGHGMQPRGHQPDHNEAYRESIGLTNTFSDEQQERARTLIYMLTEFYVPPSAHRVTNGPSAGPPDLETQRERKMGAILPLLNDIEIERAVLMPSRDAWLRCRDRGLVISGVSGTRAQPESRDKKRAVMGPLEAYFDVSDPNYPKLSDKTSPIDGRFSAARVRLFDGVASRFVLLQSKHCKGFVDGMHYRYPFQLKHRNMAQLDAKVAYVRACVEAAGHEFVARSVDVTSYDYSHSETLHVLCEETLGDRTAPFVAQLLRLGRHSPYVRASDEYDRDTYGVDLWLTRSLDDLDRSAGAQKSGDFLTSFKAKLGILVNGYEVMYRSMGGKIPVSMADWLDATPAACAATVTLLVHGDDHRVLGPKHLVDAWFEEASQPNNWFQISREDSSITAGFVLAKVGDRYEHQPDIVSFIEKTFACERSWDHPLRRNGYHIGLHAKYGHYGVAPAAHRVFAILDEVHKKHYGYDFRSYVASLPSRFGDEWGILREHPEYLHYRIDAEDVPPEVLASLYDSIPGEFMTYSYTRTATELPEVEKNVFELEWESKLAPYYVKDVRQQDRLSLFLNAL